MGETSEPLASVVINGLKLLLGKPVPAYYTAREEQFRTAMAQMGEQFWTYAGRLSMIGQGRNVVVFILLVFAAAIAVAGSRRLQARIGAMGVLSLVCFGGYNLELALSYGFIFKASQAAQLVDYNRYIYSYYIGWFLLALGCLLAALRTQITVRQVSEPDGPTAVFCTVRGETEETNGAAAACSACYFEPVQLETITWQASFCRKPCADADVKLL